MAPRAPDELVERAVALGLTGLAVTDHNGLYGAVRFMGAAEEAGLHGVVGIEIELLDAAVPDPGRRRRPAAALAPARRRRRGHAGVRADRRRRAVPPGRAPSARGCPAIATRSRRTCAGSASGQRGPHLVLLARGRGRLAEPVPARVAREPRRDQGRAAVPPGAARRAHEGLVALSGCRDGEIARRLRVGDREGARAVAERYATLFGRGDGPATSGFFIELVAPPAARRRLARRGDRRPSPRSSGCRSSSPTTSTTPRPRTASSTTS